MEGRYFGSACLANTTVYVDMGPMEAFTRALKTGASNAKIKLFELTCSATDIVNGTDHGEELIGICDAVVYAVRKSFENRTSSGATTAVAVAVAATVAVAAFVSVASASTIAWNIRGGISDGRGDGIKDDTVTRRDSCLVVRGQLEAVIRGFTFNFKPPGDGDAFNARGVFYRVRVVPDYGLGSASVVVIHGDGAG